MSCPGLPPWAVRFFRGGFERDLAGSAQAPVASSLDADERGVRSSGCGGLHRLVDHIATRRKEFGQGSEDLLGALLDEASDVVKTKALLAQNGDLNERFGLFAAPLAHTRAGATLGGSPIAPPKQVGDLGEQLTVDPLDATLGSETDHVFGAVATNNLSHNNLPNHNTVILPHEVTSRADRYRAFGGANVARLCNGQARRSEPRDAAVQAADVAT